ncbi:MAG TPA: transglutaminase family protein, partial [Chthoniobacterales bacterium]
MNLAVTHTTSYGYSTPVSLRPHVFRLRPRCDGAVRLLDWKLEIEPKPATLADCLDAEGNSVTHGWFTGITNRLTITSKFEVETLRTNPFDYLLASSAQRFPFPYPGGLACYCSPLESDDTVLNFAGGIAEAVTWRTLDFLTALNDTIHTTCPRIIREKGGPRSPGVTLRERKGSCRDLAVLFIEACRAFGIAARFVSGYHKYGTDPARRHMHAWPEVYLPGGGWRGYDPTHGLAVADLHIPVASCWQPVGAAPISGAFCSNGASST